MSARDIVMLVGRAPRRRRGAIRDLGARLQDALSEALSPDSAALSVLANGGVVTIRGEVRSLDQISRASRVIDEFVGDTEIVNLVRLRGTAT
ncbi:MAG: BON domain-containing protein [Candidatus Dormibacteria bacterium]|jgi:osmotically-inducible protein OsmY